MTKRSLFMWVLDIFTCFKHGRYLHYHCAYYFDNFNFSKSDLSNGSVVSNGFKLKLFAKFSNNYFVGKELRVKNTGKYLLLF